MEKVAKLNQARTNLYENDPSKIDPRSYGRDNSAKPLRTLKQPSEARAEIAEIKE